MECESGDLTWFAIMVAIFLATVVVERLRKMAAPRKLGTLRENWSTIAHRLGAEQPKKLPVSADKTFEDLIATVAGVEIRVSLSGWSSKSHQVSVLIETPAASGSYDLFLKNRGYPDQGAGDPLRIEVTIGDSVGVDPFRRQFGVTSNEPSLDARWLTMEVCTAMMVTEHYNFQVRDMRARAMATVDDLDVSECVAAAKALALLVSHRGDTPPTYEVVTKRLGGTFSRRPNDESVSGFEEVYALPTGEVRVDHVRHLVGVHHAKELRWTRIRAESTTSHAPFVAVHVDAPKDVAEVEGLHPAVIDALSATHRVESADPDATTPRFDLSTCQRILECVPMVLADDGTEVTAMLEGFTDDADRLAQTVELVVELARSVVGPYR